MERLPKSSNTMRQSNPVNLQFKTDSPNLAIAACESLPGTSHFNSDSASETGDYDMSCLDVTSMNFMMQFFSYRRMKH
jgi:hypothetical protein